MEAESIGSTSFVRSDQFWTDLGPSVDDRFETTGAFSGMECSGLEEDPATIDTEIKAKKQKDFRINCLQNHESESESKIQGDVSM